MSLSRQRAWRLLFKSLFLLIFVVSLPFTPIFANIGVMLLSAFSAVTLTPNNTSPTSIVVLGGGLTKTKQNPTTIILNHYSQTRASSAYQLFKQTSLPIITSGVESPWLRDYLTINANKPIVIGENASMNTCENAIFTAKLLHHHELSTNVYLVTDRYHMARARRQFALAGVSTHPYDAPLSAPLSWKTPRKNLIHSRRVVYEFVALARDIFSPQDNCRSYQTISIEEISTPRRKVSSFSLSER